MKIYAPVENINGIYASVMFVNSVGETDNPALIEWFRSHGYRIERESTVSLEEIVPIVPIVPDAPTWEVGGNESMEETEPDFEAMTPNDLREWMKEHGYGGKIRNIKNKAKLLEILRG
jgi:hypothetical protein